MKSQPVLSKMILTTLLALAFSPVGEASALPGDAGTWSQLLPPPTRRAGSPIVVDTARDRLVLFGGGDAYNQFPRNDTWVLSLTGGDWVRLETGGTAPPARSGHSAIYDPVGDRVIVFGGGWPARDDVWALSLAGTPTWSEIVPTASGPEPRVDHVAIYDSDRHALVIFGGDLVEDSPVDDTWLLPLSGSPAWSELALSGSVPIPRADASAVYDPDEKKMIVFGGRWGLSDREDTWALNLGAPSPTWTEWFPSNPPPRRAGHTAVMDPVVPGRMLIFGGRRYNVSQHPDEVWQLQNNAWTQLTHTGSFPERHFRAGAACDPLRRRLVMFGGSEFSEIENRAFGLDLGTLDWSTLTAFPDPPPERIEGHLVHDALRNRLLLVGGAAYNGGFTVPFNDLWALPYGSPDEWQELYPAGPLPPARRRPSVVYDSVRDRLLLFGGLITGEGTRNDVWELPLSGSFQWNELAPTGAAPALYAHTAVYDPLGDRMIVLGGQGSLTGEVHILAFSGGPAWTTQIGSGTPPLNRLLAHSVFDAARNRVLLYGGLDLSCGYTCFPDDLFSLDVAGTPVWSELLPTGPVPSGDLGMIDLVLDTNRDRLVRYGGASYDLWELPLAGPGLAWAELTPSGDPPNLSGLSSVFDPSGDRMLLFGPNGDDTWQLTWGTVTGIGKRETSSVRLGAAPNPFSDRTRIRFQLERPGRVTLTLHDVRGRIVAELLDEERGAGEHSVPFLPGEGAAAVSGLYFIRLVSEEGVQSRKILRLP